MDDHQYSSAMTKLNDLRDELTSIGDDIGELVRTVNRIEKVINRIDDTLRARAQGFPQFDPRNVQVDLDSVKGGIARKVD